MFSRIFEDWKKNKKKEFITQTRQVKKKKPKFVIKTLLKDQALFERRVFAKSIFSISQIQSLKGSKGSFIGFFFTARKKNWGFFFEQNV